MLAGMQQIDVDGHAGSNGGDHWSPWWTAGAVAGGDEAGDSVGAPGPAMLRRVVDALAFGIVEIDDDWRLAYANPAAVNLLREDAALSAEAGRIRIRPGQTFEQARRWLAQATAGGPLAMAVERADGAPPFLFEYLVGPPNHGGHALAILDTGRPPKVRADRLSIAFGLTAAEAHLSAAIAEGGTIATYAAGRQVTEATARTHLESVFAKTGARRQSQLVGLVAACALPLCRRGVLGGEPEEPSAAQRRNGRGTPPPAIGGDAAADAGIDGAGVKAERHCSQMAEGVGRSPANDGVGAPDGAANSEA